MVRQSRGTKRPLLRPVMVGMNKRFEREHQLRSNFTAHRLFGLKTEKRRYCAIGLHHL